MNASSGISTQLSPPTPNVFHLPQGAGQQKDVLKEGHPVDILDEMDKLQKEVDALRTNLQI
jgi:hypothetical protein